MSCQYLIQLLFADHCYKKLLINNPTITLELNFKLEPSQGLWVGRVYMSLEKEHTNVGF